MLKSALVFATVYLQKNPEELTILHICNPTGIHDIKWILFFSHRSDIKQFVVWEDTFGLPSDTSHYKTFTDHGITVLPSYPSFSLKKSGATLRTIRQLNRLIHLHKIDVVHILFTTPHSLYAPFLRAPAILTTRGSDILKVIPGLRDSRGKHRWRDKILFHLFKRAFRKAAYVTTTSQKQLDWVQQLFGIGDKCRLVRTGVDVDSIVRLDAKAHLPAALHDVKFIFSPRWMFPQYNVETQIAAIRLLPQEILKEYTFVFVHGKGIFMEPDDYFLQMRNEIQQIKGLNYVIFERLTQKETWACFKEATLAMMVPHTDGTPNSALEAMAAKCRLIMGDADYDQQLFDDTCIRVRKTDAAQLARAIEATVCSYPEGLLERAFARVNAHGNQKIEMNKVLELYRSLAQSQ